MRWRSWVAHASLGLFLCAAPAPPAGALAPAFPSTILIDANSGHTLAEQDADVAQPTTGLTQLMVLLLSLEQADLGLLRLAAPVTVSRLAVDAGCPQTRIPLHADKTYVLGELLQAMAVSAAPDAEVAVAEAMAGSLAVCLDLMNARAQRLGMTATHYGTLAGDRPDAGAGADTTTARDVARLAQALTRRNTVLQWASLSGLPFDHGATLLRNANRLLGTVDGVDGLLVTSVGDSGTYRASGPAAGRPRVTYHAVVTAQRHSLRLIAVVLGAADGVARYKTAVELLDWGFARYERFDVVKPGERLNLDVGVVNGVATHLTPVAGQGVSLLRRRDEDRDIHVRVQVPALIAAPVTRHQVLGELIVEERGRLLGVVPVLSPRNIAAGSVLSAVSR